jgi:hypothetical protein
MNFIDELLLEAEKAEEKQKIAVDKMRADHLMMAIEKLEDQLTDVNKVVDDEVKLFEDYRTVEAERLQKKIRWLAWNLEQYIKSTGEKTIRLPHGTIKLRNGRDKIEIVDLQKFLDDTENQQFLRHVPESYQPDLNSINEYIKRTGHIPEGANLVEGVIKFSFTTLKRSKDHGQDNE